LGVRRDLYPVVLYGVMQATAAAAAEKEALAQKDPEAGGAVLAALTDGDEDADAHGSKVCLYPS